MFIDTVPVTDVFTTNAYFYIDEKTRHGFLIDAGAEAQKLKRIIKEKNYIIEKILLTHGHFDHTGAVDILSDELSIPYYIHKNGKKYLEDVNYNLSIHCNRSIILKNAKYLQDKDIITLEANPDIKIEVMHTPGHTPDSVVFYDKANNTAVVGDTIFKGAIGNAGYLGGNAQELRNSILNKIFLLPSLTVLYSGHSDRTTVGEEKARYNIR